MFIQFLLYARLSALCVLTYLLLMAHMRFALLLAHLTDEQAEAYKGMYFACGHMSSEHAKEQPLVPALSPLQVCF